MSKNIGYHTRLYTDSTVKVVGGSFGGELSMETANRLTRLFDVVVKPSGTPVFVDRQGREVWLYLTVDARETEKGKAALKAWQEERAKIEREQEELEEQHSEEIKSLMLGLTHEEIVRRLKDGA